MTRTKETSQVTESHRKHSRGATVEVTEVRVSPSIFKKSPAQELVCPPSFPNVRRSEKLKVKAG